MEETIQVFEWKLCFETNQLIGQKNSGLPANYLISSDKWSISLS